MAAPTENDYNVFWGFSREIKCQIIKGYLLDGKKMKELGREIFPSDSDFSAGEKVSCVMRCYGFEGRNYGCFFRWGIASDVTDADIMDFISQYPDGCRYDEVGGQMRSFLTERIEKRRIEAESKKIAELEEARRNALIKKQEEIAEFEERKRQLERRRAFEKAQREVDEKSREIEAVLKEANERWAETNAKEFGDFLDRCQKYMEDAAKKHEEMERKRLAQQEREKNALVAKKFAVDNLNNAKTNKEFLEAVRGLRAILSVSKITPDDYDLLYLSKAARILYDKGKYFDDATEEILGYCQFVCNIGIGNWENEWIIRANAFNGSLSKNTRLAYAECLGIMSDIYWLNGMRTAAIRVAELGILYNSRESFEVMDMYLCREEMKKQEELGFELHRQYLSREDTLLLAYCEEKLAEMDGDDEHLWYAREKAVSMWAEEVRNAYGDGFLPAPEPGQTWEEYSNLTADQQKKLKRKCKHPNLIDVRVDWTPNSYVKVSYKSGKINLSALWESYKTAYANSSGNASKSETEAYDGDMWEGDFADCMEYMWRNKYGIIDKFGDFIVSDVFDENDDFSEDFI